MAETFGRLAFFGLSAFVFGVAEAWALFPSGVAPLVFESPPQATETERLRIRLPRIKTEDDLVCFWAGFT